MKLHAKHWRSVYVPKALAVGEGPDTWSAYFSQQMRWASGCMDILRHHSPTLLPQMRKKHGFYYLILQQHYFSGVAMVLGIGLLSLYFLFGIVPTNFALHSYVLLYFPLLLWQSLVALWLQRFTISPDKESGLLIKGKLISIAAWPVYFMAFIGVLRGKRITYKVTPKGKSDRSGTPLSVFRTHIILGSITGLDLIAAAIDHRQAVIMLFWAGLNTMLMYGIAFHTWLLKAYQYINRPIYIRTLFGQTSPGV
jgi:cellulose synthase/poly-beta-1,6-N-acetylglucosamine synthase-like glycosyltransferase